LKDRINYALETTWFLCRDVRNAGQWWHIINETFNDATSTIYTEWCM